MTELRDAIIFVGCWRPSPDTTILNYLNGRERGAPLSFVEFWRPPQTPQYLTILLTERGVGITFCRILVPPPQCQPPSSPDATILHYFNDREGGVIKFCRILAPLPQTPQDLTILMTRRWGGAPISCKKLNI